MKHNTLITGAILMLFSFAGFSCSRYDTNPAEVPDPAVDESLATSDATAEKTSDTLDASDASDNADTAEVGKVDEKTTTPDNAATKEIVLAGGCFWCVEAVYEQLEGVIDVESGYAGGDPFTANYQAVKSGQTKHAEAVRITYDPSKITYGTILKVFFSTAHDPTTLNRQGADEGPQYRSAIFYATDAQRDIAQAYIKQLNDAGVYRSPIVTTLEPLTQFFVAESYHQDYARQNPNQPYIQGVSTPKVVKTRKAYPELLRDEAAEDK